MTGHTCSANSMFLVTGGLECAGCGKRSEPLHREKCDYIDPFKGPCQAAAQSKTGRCAWHEGWKQTAHQEG